MYCPRLIYKFVVSLIVILFWLSFGPSSFAATFDRVVAKVNNEIITLSAVELRAAVILNRNKSSGSLNKQSNENELMKSALNLIINEKLQTQEAKKNGMKVNEETVQTALEDVYANNNITAEQFKTMLASEGGDLESYKNVIRDQILASRVVRMELGSNVGVGKREIRKYYTQNKKDFWVPAQRIVSHIMFIQEQSLSAKEVKLKKRKAQEVLQRIRSGEKFSDLAKSYSEDVSSHSGGRIGIVERGMMMPEFENAAFSLKVGEVSNIVETENGLHIIKCNEILPGYFKIFKEVSSEIRKVLEVNKKEKAYQKWMKNLRQSAFIEITLDEDTSKSKKVVRAANRPFGSDRARKVAKTKSPRKTGRLSKSQKQLVEGVDSMNHHSSIESKLKHYKKLRDTGEISERKYQAKKKKLLEKF